jgi:hypothetical protein
MSIIPGITLPRVAGGDEKNRGISSSHRRSLLSCKNKIAKTPEDKTRLQEYGIEMDNGTPGKEK